MSKGYMTFYRLILSILCVAMCGCARPPEPDLPTASKGYVLYVSADRTELRIDFCKSDGISRGTRLDVFRMDVPDMDEPVKIGEVTVEDVGKKMSTAKVTRITSSLKMERGDRVFPHPIDIVSDSSWLTSRTPVDGWKSDPSSSDERYWEPCEVLSRVSRTPEINQLLAETDAQPIWHPSVTSRHGDVFFRKVFRIDASPTDARVRIICGGKTNIYLNDRWVGETEEWPEISSFRVKTFLKQGKNLIAIHTIRDQRATEPPVLFLALSIQTEFR